MGNRCYSSPSPISVESPSPSTSPSHSPLSSLSLFPILSRKSTSSSLNIVSLQKNYTAYVYVPRKDLPNILLDGLMSARILVEKYPEKKSEIIAKYNEQFTQALSNGEYGVALYEYITKTKDRSFGANELLDILDYLDWREEETEKGSLAIYFLFHPIPNHKSIRKYIKEYRDNFLDDRVLLEFNIASQDIMYIHEVEIQEEETMTHMDLTLSSGIQAQKYDSSIHCLFSQGQAFWINKWKQVILQEMKERKENDDYIEQSLWFQDITHGFIVPVNGMITNIKQSQWE